jgi:RHS repeat-associated protein
VEEKEREFVYYPGSFEPLAIIDDTKAVNWVHTDSVGLPHEVTGPDGDLVWSASYDAYGCVETVGNETLQNPLRFQGQYYDPEIELSYNRHRYYDQHTGSFISQDPLGLAAGTNIYTYASNVWGWVDPLGLECKQILQENSELNLQKRSEINRIALKYDGNGDWAYLTKKGNFQVGSNKCNKFVYDVLKEAGAIATVKNRPPLAAEWADPKTKIKNWRMLGTNETPEPGDVAAYKIPGHTTFSGHTGFITNNYEGNISAHEFVVSTVDGQFTNAINPGTRYRRYTGE